MAAARWFVRDQSRRSAPAIATSASVPVEVGSTLEGFNPCFRPDVLVIARVEDRNKDFNQMGVDPRRAFNPVSNVVNSKSILFDDSDVGSRLIEAMVFPRDRHAMFHSEETTMDFAERLYDSIALVSCLTFIFFPAVLYACE